MQIWPAIDLRGGKCVRLQQGDYARETVFGTDPAEMARHWVAEGAKCLHLVDLDGARKGEPVNVASIEAIRAAVQVPCQLGGGLRDDASVRRMFDIGIDRVIIGSGALEYPDWLRRICRHFPRQIVLGIDARDGRVATGGWMQTSDMDATDLARMFSDEPLAGIVFTDIATDGMLSGPNLMALAAMRNATSLPVLASGGITTLDDIRRLANAGVPGCIIGRALYEGAIALRDALAIGAETVKPGV